MSLETLLLLRQILAQQTLSVGAEDFAQVSIRIATALAELDHAIEKARSQQDSPHQS